MQRYRYVVAHRCGSKLVVIFASEQPRTSAYGIKVKEQFDKGRLAAARSADNTDDFAVAHVDGNIVQNIIRRVTVGKTYVLEFDVARQNFSAGFVRRFVVYVEYGGNSAHTYLDMRDKRYCPGYHQYGVGD